MKFAHPVFALPLLSASLFLGGCDGVDVALEGETIPVWETGYSTGYSHASNYRHHSRSNHRVSSNGHRHAGASHRSASHAAPHGKRR